MIMPAGGNTSAYLNLKKDLFGAGKSNFFGFSELVQSDSLLAGRR